MQGPTDPGGVPGVTPAKPERSLGVAAGLVGLATLASRVLGLVREQMFAAFVGASAYSDAFIVGFRIPNLLRDLFAEGALSAAFVPTFKATLKKEGPQQAYRLGNVIAGNLLVIVGGIVLAAALFAPQIVDAMAGDFASTPG